MWPKKSAFFSDQTHPCGSQENLSVKKQRRRTVPWSGTSVMPHTAAGHSLPTGPLRRGTLWPHHLRPARGFPGRRPVGEAPKTAEPDNGLSSKAAPHRQKGPRDTQRCLLPGHARPPPGQRSPSPPGTHLLRWPAQVLQQAPQEVQQQRHGRTARRKEPQAGTPHASSPGWRHLSAAGAGRKGSFANRETAVLSTANGGPGAGRSREARREGAVWMPPARRLVPAAAAIARAPNGHRGGWGGTASTGGSLPGAYGWGAASHVWLSFGKMGPERKVLTSSVDIAIVPTLYTCVTSETGAQNLQLALHL